MLKSYLIPIEDAFLLFLILAFLSIIPLCIFHYHRFGYLRPIRAVIFYLFLFYTLCAISLVILPLPELTNDFCQSHPLSQQLQPIPFNFIGEIISNNSVSLRHLNLVSIFKSFSFLQAFFNFLLLIPLGFFLRYYYRFNFYPIVVIAIATTLTFEITQITGIFGIYPCAYRIFDVDDLILNTLGAIVGYLVIPLFWFLPKIDQKVQKAPHNVSLTRRLIAFIIDWFIANTISRLIFLLLLAQPNYQHSVWLDLLIYCVWFIGIPLLWNGETLGKKLVLIRLTSTNNDQKINFLQLLIRYGVLIYIPIVTETLFTQIFANQQKTLGYVDGISSMLFLSLMGLQILLLFGFAVVRKDHRGIHELFSRTKNTITQYPQ